MSRKGVKCLGWTLVDENIENVERLTLDLETQNKLGCLVGRHVFLEYPWAYVPKKTISTFFRSESLRHRIESYQADAFLLGYASNSLTGRDFVICLTEEAKRAVEKRNQSITRRILHQVAEKITKTPRTWKSLGSEEEIESFVVESREKLEIEITTPGSRLGRTRRLCDRPSDRHSYLQLANGEFQIVWRERVCRTTQTHLESRDVTVQTYPGYPKNIWTQYVYEDTLDEPPNDPEEEASNKSVEGEDEEEEKKGERIRVEIETKDEELEPREKTPLELFLEARSEEMIDAVKYNTVVNLHVDDIQKLSEGESRTGTGTGTGTGIDEPVLRERVSFIDLNITANKAVADVTWHPKLPECVVISYVTSSNETVSSGNGQNGSKFETRALLWNSNDPLRPQLELRNHGEICRVSFCPNDESIVIGGSSGGQIIIWNIKDYLCGSDGERNGRNTRFGTRQKDVPIVVSDKHRSHRKPVRKIQWMPASCSVEPSGKLTKSTSAMQFLTASEDGTIAVWDLSDFDSSRVNDNEDDCPFRPVYRLKVQAPLLSLCLPGTNVTRERESNSKALGIICMACASPALVGATHWFLFVAVTAFIATLLWCFIYLLSIREALKLPINWIMTELTNTAVFTVLYMIAFIAQLSVWSALSHSSASSNIAGGVFGIFNTIVYAAGAYFLYVEWKNSGAQ